MQQYVLWIVTICIVHCSPKMKTTVREEILKEVYRVVGVSTTLNYYKVEYNV